MTIQSITGAFAYPPTIAGQDTGKFSVSGLSTAVNGDRVAFVFDAPATGTITGASVHLTANVGGCDIRLETVVGSGATSGQATGTLAGTNTNLAVAAGSTGVRTVVFTGSYSATIGDRLALVVNNTGAAQTVTVIVAALNTSMLPIWQGVSTTYTSSAGTYTFNGRAPIMAINYNGTYYWIPGAYALNNTPDTTSTMSNGHERGIQFTSPPFPVQVCGWFINTEPSSRSADYSVILYDNAGGPSYGTIIQRTGILGGYSRVGTSYGQTIVGSFNGVATIPASTVVNLVVQQTTANALRYHEAQLLDTGVTAMLGAWPLGSSLKGINRTSTANSFTTSQTQFSGIMGLLLNGGDDGATVGNSVAIPIGGRLAQV